MPAVSLASSLQQRAAVATPTVGQQVDRLFLTDLSKNPDLVDDNTLYVFYNGANDLSQAFFAFLDGEITAAQFVKAISITIPRDIVGSEDAAVEKLLSGLEDQSITNGNILIVPQFNLGITPVISYSSGVSNPIALKVIAKGLGELVKIYNSRLTYYTEQAAEANPAFHFYLADNLFDVMNTEAFSLKHTPTFGQACQDDATIYNSAVIPNGEIPNCVDKLGSPFMYWNTMHLAAPGQQVIAKALLDYLADATPMNTAVNSGAFSEKDLIEYVESLKAKIDSLK